MPYHTVNGEPLRIATYSTHTTWYVCLKSAVILARSREGLQDATKSKGSFEVNEGNESEREYVVNFRHKSGMLLDSLPCLKRRVISLWLLQVSWSL